MIHKKVGGIVQGNPLQTVDYQYNIRGWLRQINDINDLQDDLFAFKINYETPTFESSTALFNGNISETFWRSATDNIKRHYSYNYDDLNRLKEAIYGRNMNITNNYNESLWYDKNGNIEKLTRFGQNDFGMPIPLDDLIYQYKNNNQSNILTRVTETNLGNPAAGFIDGSNTNDDYQYDEFGNPAPARILSPRYRTNPFVWF
jgi:hypothetical protein